MVELRPTSNTGSATKQILIRMLGNFQMIAGDRAVVLPTGGKAETFLAVLALHPEYAFGRERILGLLWPEHDVTLAGQALNTLIYRLRKHLDKAHVTSQLVLQTERTYQLNSAVVQTDVACFDALALEGDRQLREGLHEAACNSYCQAASIYRGDLWLDVDISSAVERERLRARYLTVLARLADVHFAQGHYEACRAYAGQLLASDPCREDAHRLIMRCFAREGERAQALHQYRFCCAILRAEFDMIPEALTTDLYQRIRLSPEGV